MRCTKSTIYFAFKIDLIPIVAGFVIIAVAVGEKKHWNIFPVKEA